MDNWHKLLVASIVATALDDLAHICAGRGRARTQRLNAVVVLAQLSETIPLIQSVFDAAEIDPRFATRVTERLAQALEMAKEVHAGTRQPFDLETRGRCYKGRADVVADEVTDDDIFAALKQKNRHWTPRYF